VGGELQLLTILKMQRIWQWMFAYNSLILNKLYVSWRIVAIMVHRVPQSRMMVNRLKANNLINAIEKPACIWWQQFR
jgi:hypothetical protein